MRSRHLQPQNPSNTSYFEKTEFPTNCTVTQRKYLIICSHEISFRVHIVPYLAFSWIKQSLNRPLCCLATKVFILLGRRGAPDQSFHALHTSSCVRVKFHALHEYPIYTSRLSMILFAIQETIL